jgi:hypothetical protein
MLVSEYGDISPHHEGVSTKLISVFNSIPVVVPDVEENAVRTISAFAIEMP